MLDNVQKLDLYLTSRTGLNSSNYHHIVEWFRRKVPVVIRIIILREESPDTLKLNVHVDQRLKIKLVDNISIKMSHVCIDY